MRVANTKGSHGNVGTAVGAAESQRPPPRLGEAAVGAAQPGVEQPQGEHGRLQGAAATLQAAGGQGARGVVPRERDLPAGVRPAQGPHRRAQARHVQRGALRLDRESGAPPAPGGPRPRRRRAAGRGFPVPRDSVHPDRPLPRHELQAVHERAGLPARPQAHRGQGVRPEQRGLDDERVCARLEDLAAVPL
ncbi:MAG: hypothetical protein CL844_05595 [Crocinitomicaceae bacterium]|nr:hypothetical protein [Crocinitomicaceae bacterium]